MNLAQFRHEMRAALTPVYPAKRKPVRPGLYLVNNGTVPTDAPRFFAYWTGRAWSMAAYDLRAAWQNRALPSEFQQRTWQGVVRH